jgi:hypothetical protein
MCHSLQRDGVKVDVLIYEGGDLLKNEDCDRPANVGKIVNVRSRGLVFLSGGKVNGTDITGAENLHLGDEVHHSAMPCHERVLQMLARTLADQASQ